MIIPYFNNARQVGAGSGAGAGVGIGISGTTWSSGHETLHPIHQTYGSMYPMYVAHPHVIYSHVIHPIGFSTFPFGSTYYL